jgi:hypothetical protein
MGEPRKLKDPPVSLAEFRALMNSTAQGPCPVMGGDEEWFSEDLWLQARAAALCQACSLLQVCRAYAIAEGEKKGVWGATTPAKRRAIRRRAA